MHRPFCENTLDRDKLCPYDNTTLNGQTNIFVGIDLVSILVLDQPLHEIGLDITVCKPGTLEISQSRLIFRLA